MAVSRDMTSCAVYGTSSVVVNGEAKKNESAVRTRKL